MFNPKSRFRNLGSLYDMNREENASNQKVKELEDEENVFRQESNLANRRYSTGQTASGNDALERAKAKAKTISDSADSFNPEAQIRKQGLGGQAAGVTSFYGGQAGEDNTSKLKRFSNLYSTVAGQQARAVDNSKNVLALPDSKPRPQTYSENVTQTKNTNDSIARNAGRKGPEINALNDLEWLYKTGRISQNDYYKAQKDDDHYAMIMKMNGFGG
jgi:hypothetical protein